MDNQDDIEDQEQRVGEGSDDAKADTITIRLPTVSSYTPESRYEPNYVAVVTNEQQQRDNEHRQHQREMRQNARVPTPTSPEYTVLSRGNFNKNQNEDSEDDEAEDNYAHKKFTRQASNLVKKQQLQVIPVIVEPTASTTQVVTLELNPPLQQQQPNHLHIESDGFSHRNAAKPEKLEPRIYKGSVFTKSKSSSKPRQSKQLHATQVTQDESYRGNFTNRQMSGNEQNAHDEALYPPLGPEHPFSANDLRFRKRNLLVERRFAIRRAISNSRGLMSITTPIEDVERSNNFVFAVANENVSHQIGYNSDLDSYSVYSPETVPPKSRDACRRSLRKRNHNAASAKTKTESNHSTVTFLYKDKQIFSSDDILNYDKANFDPYGPGPASYHVPRRPLNERVAPSYTFGQRCQVEKKGGGRTSWEKEYFSSNNPFLIKTDFKRDKKWPTPHDYVKKSTIGETKQATIWHQYPSYSMGPKSIKSDDSKQGGKQLPHLHHGSQSAKTIIAAMTGSDSPGEQTTPDQIPNSAIFDEKIYQFILKPKLRNNHNNDDSRGDRMDEIPYYREHKEKITLKSRPYGTQLWPKPEKTPGPGAHDHTKFSSIKPSKPKFSMTSAYGANVNYTGGPYAVI